MKQKILCAAFGYGRGHATRAATVLSALVDHDVMICASGDALDTLRAAGHSVFEIPAMRYAYHRGRTSMLPDRIRDAWRCAATCASCPTAASPCAQFNTERVGNLATDDLDSVWHGASARSARRWVDACPGCWAECEVIPSALYTADVRGLVGLG